MITCICLTIVYSFYFLNKIKLDNTAYWSGDTIVYQSIAVNLATGHGYKYGIIEPFEKYKFGKGLFNPKADLKEELTDWGKEGGHDYFFTTPGYILFLGSIYKIFGISPFIAKVIQNIFMITIGSFLPFIGYIFWKRSGLVSGIISGFIYLNHFFSLEAPGSLAVANEILTEPLISFYLFLMIIVFMYWSIKKSFITTFSFGVLLGIGVLVKGSNIFIPLLFLTYFFILIFIKRSLSLAHLSVLLSGIIISILPWSIYATKSSDQLILISTQSKPALFDGNNEYTVIDGAWHPEGYIDNPNSFYRQPWLQKYPDLIKVAIFYYYHPRIFLPVFLKKLFYAYRLFPFFKISLTLIISSILINYFLNKKFKIVMLMITLLCLINIFIFPYPVTGMPFMSQISTSGSLLTVLLTVAMLLAYRKKIIHTIDIPAPMIIIFVNYLLITLMIFGYPRYIQVMNFVFILVSVKLLMDFIKEFFSTFYSVFFTSDG